MIVPDGPHVEPVNEERREAASLGEANKREAKAWGGAERSCATIQKKGMDA
jgi:hypothetical protein